MATAPSIVEPRTAVRPGAGARLWRAAVQVFNRRTWSEYRAIRPREWWPANRIRELQWQRLLRITTFAWEHNRFYRELWTAHGVSPRDLRRPEDVRRLPIVDKSMLREALEAGTALSDRYERPVYPMASTGSTGEPFRFPLDAKSARERRALTFRTREAAGYYDGDPNVKLWRTDGAAGPRERVRRRLHRLVELSVYDATRPERSRLDEARLAEMCDRIRSHRPRVIEGYVSALSLLARHVVANGIEDATAESVICGGETLSPALRRLIARAFRARVFNRYGGTEVGVIAHECGADPAHRLHLQSDAALVEFLAADGRPVRPGEVGELVVTSFTSRALPLVRYRVGDLGRPEDPGMGCACGRGLPLVREIIGRVNDVFVFPGGETLSSHVFHKIFRGAAGVRRFQIVQTDWTRFEITLERDGAAIAPSVLEALRFEVGRYLSDCSLTWTVVDEIPPGPGGKLRQCVRAFSAGESVTRRPFRRAVNGLGDHGDREVHS